MDKRPLPLWVICLVNVGAVYLPALFWVPSLAGSGKGWALLFFPVLLFLFLGEVHSLLACSALLGSSLLVVVLLTAVLCRRGVVSLWLLTLLFWFSLLQGLTAVSLAAGWGGLGR
jgi:hypothetical protein